MPITCFIEEALSGNVWTIYQVVPKSRDVAFMPVIQQLNDWECGVFGEDVHMDMKRLLQEEAASILDLFIVQADEGCSEEVFCRDESDRSTRNVVCIPGRMPHAGDMQWQDRKQRFTRKGGHLAYDLTRVWAVHYPTMQVTILVEVCIKTEGGSARNNMYCRQAMQRAMRIEHLIDNGIITLKHSKVIGRDFEL